MMGGDVGGVRCGVLLACVLAATLNGGARAADELPVMRASSTRVDVEDGGRVLRGIWNISPETELDVYYARRVQEERRVTFRTDLDSISFDVRPGQHYDFEVLLNGKRCCHTRISTQREVLAAEDVIPFTLGRDGKIHVTGRFNDSEPLDLLLDLGADSVVVYPSGLDKGVAPRVDGTIENLGTGGIVTRGLSHHNRIVLGRLSWDREPLILIEKQADRADGILGYNLFDGKVVTFDYDAQQIRVTDRVPENARAWSRLPVAFHGTLPGVTATFERGGESFTEWLALDTGSNASVFLDGRAAARHGFYEMPRLGSSEMRGTGAAVARNQVVLLPKLALGDKVLIEVPLHLEAEGGKGGGLEGHLGMDVLKRFNMAVDLREDAIYLVPSGLHATNYRAVSGVPRWGIAVAVAVALAMGAAFLFWRRRLRSRDAVISKH
jgi:hypothetical protein